jgi:predicted peptidase
MLRKYLLEILLALSVLSLAAQLGWPNMIRWWHRPTPGHTGFASLAPAGGIAPTYCLHLPADYDADTGAWPLVVFLHGSGECGNDPALLREFRFVGSTRELSAIVAAPQCLPGSSWEPESVVAFIEHVADSYRVNRQKICLVGTSMGGYGTWRAAAAHPGMFAAIVPICGGGDPVRAEAFRDLAVWAFHGERDEVIPVEESERMIEAIRKSGGHPRLTVLPNAGHGICETVCLREELWEWLFHQRRNEIAAETSEINMRAQEE